jgi:hypothetical protein
VGLSELGKKQEAGPPERAGFFSSFSVIPAEAGIQECQELVGPGICPGPDPRFARLMV